MAPKLPKWLSGLTALAAGVVAITALWLAPALAAGTGYVFVSNERTHNILVYDPADDHAVIGEIATSRRPRDMAFSPDNTLLYVACGDDDVVEVIDVATLEIIDRIPTGRSPEMIAISDDGQTLYVTNEESSTLQAIDLVRKETLFEVETGAEPEGLILSEDGAIIYVASEIADMVHVIDAELGIITDSVIVGSRPRRFALTADGSELWVSDELSGTLTIIDRATNTVAETIAFSPPGVRAGDVTPVDILISDDGGTMYVALGQANQIAFVDVETREVTGYALTGSRPWGLNTSADGRYLYVTNGLSDDMSVIDLRTRRNVLSIPAGRVPHSVIVDG